MARTIPRQAAMVVTALLVGLGAAACKADDWPVNGQGAAAISDSIDLQVIGYLDGNRLPGATVAVTRSGRLVWSKGYGWAHLDDQVEMQPWHRSRIGSVSKLLTTIGVLQLVEETDLALDTPVYGHPGDTVSDPAWPTVTGPTALPDPEQYWEGILEGVVDFYGPIYTSDLFRVIDWASNVELGHLLSHTSGLLRSGHIGQVEEYYGVDASELTYTDVHLAILKAVIDEREDSVALECYLDGALRIARDDAAYTGARHRLPPFVYEPGTDRCYSNHGFGLLGHIIDERSGTGPANTYRQVIERKVLHQLGLFDVVPNNSRIRDGRDAWPHGDALDPSSPSGLGMPTGGWSAAAQDMARVMCGLDRRSNWQRLLQPQTVQQMETVRYPVAGPGQPLGWDWRSGSQLYKNGSIGGGVSVVMKFLPGSFPAAPNDEINVAFMVNGSTDEMPPLALVRDIARKVAEADIPDDYDLFDPTYPCRVEGPTLQIHAPSDGFEVPLGTELMFEAEAYDWRGEPLSITWDLPGGQRLSQPNAAGGRHALFVELPRGEHMVTATATDSAGNAVSALRRVVVTYDPPRVTIVSHSSGDQVWAGEPLHLVGQGVMGTAFPLPDGALQWEVRRGGQVVYQGTGALLTVPGSVIVPGNFSVRLSGNDGVGADVTTVTLTAVEKSPDLPVATIRAPADGSVHVADTGGKVTVQFAGFASDADGNAIAGVNFRWTAIYAGAETVLCAGTGMGGPPSSGGGFAIPTSCASFSADLSGIVIGGYTEYTIVLEVRDSQGRIGESRAAIRVFTPQAG
jgi:CubicO group peptidase (beta-lactamase class C family)